MLHASLRCLRLFQLDVQLFKLCLCASKLAHCLIIVHLLDLIVLELLLVKLLGAGLVILRSSLLGYSFETGKATLLHGHSQRSCVVLHPRRIHRLVETIRAGSYHTLSRSMHVLPWHSPMHRLVKKSIPTLSQLLFVNMRLCGRLFPRWIVIEHLCWLLFRSNHSFNFV